MKHLILLTLIFTILTVGAYAAEINKTKKIKVLFSMDQGLGNGPVINDDYEAINRMIKAVAPLRKKYDVYFLLNPMVTEQKHEKVMDILYKAQMPFVLDVIASDSWSFGSLAPDVAKPFDVYHGVSISPEKLEIYKKKYGRILAGIRFFEIFGADFTIRCCKSDSTESWIDWYRKNYKICEDDFFQIKITEPFLEIAQKYNMFVQWSDFHWGGNCTWDKEAQEDESQLAELIKKYPNLIYTCYDNNEPNEDSIKRLGDWHLLVNKFDSAAGFGLSNQTWIYKDYMKCPISIITDWSNSAIKNGASILQFEPVEYYFKFPQSSEKKIDYKTEPEWKDSGKPTENFNKLMKYLMDLK